MMMIRQSSNVYICMHACNVYVYVCINMHVYCTPEEVEMLNTQSDMSVGSLVLSTGTETVNYLSPLCDLVGLGNAQSVFKVLDISHFSEQP